jgi:hypothetical protein
MSDTGHYFLLRDVHLPGTKSSIDYVGPQPHRDYCSMEHCAAGPTMPRGDIVCSVHGCDSIQSQSRQCRIPLRFLSTVNHSVSAVHSPELTMSQNIPSDSQNDVGAFSHMSLQSCFPHLTLDAGGYVNICYQFSEQKSRESTMP